MNSLYVVATPIGNLEDITIRAIKTLLTVPTVACEDTRHTGNLLKILKERYATLFELPNISTHYLSIRDWNEAESIDKLILALQSNDVALVSDAGTPLISDPGFKIVRAVKAAGFQVVPIPGPTAAITALQASGLPTDKFVFWGFLPKKWELYPSITNIIYESPYHLHKTISAITTRYPQADIVVAAELTKIHEKISDKIEALDAKPKGEFVILVNFSPS